MSYLVKLSFDPKKRYCRILADDGIHGVMNSQGPYRWRDSVSGGVIDRNDPDNDGRWFEVQNLSLDKSGKFYRVLIYDIVKEVSDSPLNKIGPIGNNIGADTNEDKSNYEVLDWDNLFIENFNVFDALGESYSTPKLHFKLIEGLSREEMIDEMENMGHTRYNWDSKSDESIYRMYEWALKDYEKEKLNHEYDLYMRELERNKEPSNYIADMPDADDYDWVSAYNNYDIYYNTKTDEYKIDGLKATYPTEQEAEEAIKDMEES